MKWIDINEQQPVDTSSYKDGTIYIVRVVCDSWDNPKTMIMEYWETPKRGSDNHWKWNNSFKMNAWVITHWMPLPTPELIEQ